MFEAKPRGEAYVNWNAGKCRVIDRETQKVVAESRHFRRATRAAQNKGYNVTVYCAYASEAPRDAVNATDGSYVLPFHADWQRDEMLK